MGNVGQADYATANGFMDQFAIYRNGLVDNNQRKGRTLSVNWPLWLEGGMSIGSKGPKFLQHGVDIHALQTTAGMQALYRSLDSQAGQVLVMEGDVSQLRRALFVVRTETPERVVDSSAKQPAVFQSARTNVESLVERTEDYLRKQLSTVLKIPSHRIDIAAPLEKYGIDSIVALSLTNRLEKAFGSLPKTLFFEYQTIREASGYFMKFHSAQVAKLFDAPTVYAASEISVHDPAQAVPSTSSKGIASNRFRHQHRDVASSTPSTPIDTISKDPIAIIGLSGRYPEAVNLEAYWRNLGLAGVL
jgi:acyl carrier protein